MLKAFSVFRRDLSGVNIDRKIFDALNRFFDLRPNLRNRRKPWIPEPVMTDHALFIGIGDSSRLQIAHRRKCFFNQRLHFHKKIVREFHPADIDAEIEIAVVQKIFLKTLP